MARASSRRRIGWVSHFYTSPHTEGDNTLLSFGSIEWVGLTHEITIVREQGRQGAYAEDRSIRALGVDMLSEYLLPRRDEYTRVYTTVYPRVHNCIHACTQVRSKYILCRARLCVCFLGIMSRISRDELGLPGI